VTRLVIDANALLSASLAAADTPLAMLLGAVRAGTVEMVICDHLLTEVRRGLESSYFRERLDDDEREGIPDGFAHVGLSVADPTSPPRVLRDPDDDYLVALAKNVGADAIVTGDRDLLDHDGLNPPAITPRQACVRLGVIPG
jgi:putative PIN family toxin of toxin-antitoxin system